MIFSNWPMITGIGIFISIFVTFFYFLMKNGWTFFEVILVIIMLLCGTIVSGWFIAKEGDDES